MTVNSINTPLITLGGALTMTGGSFTFTGTLSGNTAVTFPTSGTLLTSTGAVTSITGTANQVVASASTGAVTLSLPQSLATSSALTFGSVTFSSTSGIIGTTTNDNAAAGSVGQVISSAVAWNAVSLSSGVGTNITSISLTAGQWDIYGFVTFVAAGATTITGAIQAGINTSSATMPDVTNPSISTPSAYDEQMVTTGKSTFLTLPPGVVKLSGTTIYYLVAQPNFAVSTMTGGGYLYAVRRR